MQYWVSFKIMKYNIRWFKKILYYNKYHKYTIIIVLEISFQYYFDVLKLKIKSRPCLPVFLGGACEAALGGPGGVFPFLLSFTNLFAFFIHSDTIPSNKE